jgi:DUF971 family protein
MEQSVQPVEITRDAGERRMLVRWADGHVSYYPWRDLRFVCPCAHCSGEWGQPGAMAGTRLEDLTEQQTSMADIVLVGRYAVQPTWADGHDTGIYAFRVLRQTCPCGQHGGESAAE